MTLYDATGFVLDLLRRFVFGGSSAASTLPHGPLVDDGGLKDDDDWFLGDLFTCGALDPQFALKADFDRLLFACKQAAIGRPAKMTDIVAVAKELFESQQGPPPQVT